MHPGSGSAADPVEPPGGPPAAPAGPRPSPWAPLRRTVFRALFIAQLVSAIGTMVQGAGSAWIMGDLGASPALVAMVQTATYLPVLLVSVPGGALADIVDRRRLLIWVQLLMMSASLGLTGLAAANAVTPAWLLAMTFLLGIGNAVNTPAWAACQPDLVPRQEVGQAMALNAMTLNLGRAVGPAVGGLLLAAAGPTWVFGFNAASFLAVVAALAHWRWEQPERRQPVERLPAATRAAFRYGLNAPVFRGVLARTAAMMLPAAALQALLPVVVRDGLHLGPSIYGLFLALFGAGAAGGAVLKTRLDERFTPDRIVTSTSLVMAGGLVVNGFVHQPVIVGLAGVAAGAAWGIGFITTSVAAQSTLSGWVRARGLGMYMLVNAGCLALASAVWGVAAARWGLGGAHLAAALTMLAGVALVRSSLSITRGIDMTLVPATAPAVVLHPGPEDGPVLVTLTYLVPEGDVPAFVAAMRAVERHRRRIGARRWQLYRDLGAPDRFVETFSVMTWADHLRQLERRTVATDANLTGVGRYLDPTVGPGHLLSAYSAGALASRLLDPSVPAVSPPDVGPWDPLPS